MVNQKLISFKIDSDLLPALDEYCRCVCLKRNSALNIAVRHLVANISTFELTKLIAREYDLYRPRFVDGFIVYD